jgi:hypothetical protein
MPTLFIHGIGNHDWAQFIDTFHNVRDRLRSGLADQRESSPSEAAFYPVYWGDWGPYGWYRGLSLPPGTVVAPGDQGDMVLRAAGVFAKSAGPMAAASFDAGLDALTTVLSAPGPLGEVLDDLGISEAALLHAAAQTRGQPQRAAATVTRLLVRERLHPGQRASTLSARAESRDALRALLTLILDPPQPMPKALPSAVTYPFWATVTALARHLRGSIMQAATSFVGDVMLYLSRGAELRQVLHVAVKQAYASHPEEPLVLIAHSLGGVLAYDYLSDPSFGERPPVDLMVTVGSQVGLFAEYGILQDPRIRPGAGAPPRPIHPPACLRGSWLNIYDPDDFLSFPVRELFLEAAGDSCCPSGKPFPASHSAYWDNDQVYATIVETFPTWRD